MYTSRAAKPATARSPGSELAASHKAFSTSPRRTLDGGSVRQSTCSWSFSEIPVFPTHRTIQTKLAINQPGDEYEREADRIAEQMTAAPADAAGPAVPLSVRPVSGHWNTDPVPASVDRTLASAGATLQSGVRQDMERRFGHDFSRVRLHSGAAAEQSASDINARAYTVGHNIVFGSNGFAPATPEGRRLLAHELTHVLQQRVPGVLQRDNKDSAAKKKEVKKVDPKVEAVKKKLQDKFGFKEITDSDDVSWTVPELNRLYAAFSKMLPVEQENLKGVTLHRVKEIASPSGLPRDIKIGGDTFGFKFIQFTSSGLNNVITPLHEVGHLLRNRGFEEIRTNSPEAADEEAARMKLGSVRGPAVMVSDIEAVAKAAKALRDSDDEQRDARANELDAAMDTSAGIRLDPQIQSATNAKAIDEFYQRLDLWVDTVRRLADARAKIIKEFIALVKKDNLADKRKKFRPFNRYVQFSWPAKPDEFFAQCYAEWRNDRDYMKAHAADLFDWFEKGGHLVSKPAPSKKP
jgi:hypothetical protein